MDQHWLLGQLAVATGHAIPTHFKRNSSIAIWVLGHFSCPQSNSRQNTALHSNMIVLFSPAFLHFSHVYFLHPPPPPIFPILRSSEHCLYSAHTCTNPGSINVPINLPIPTHLPTHSARPSPPPDYQTQSLQSENTCFKVLITTCWRNIAKYTWFKRLGWRVQSHSDAGQDCRVLPLISTKDCV